MSSATIEPPSEEAAKPTDEEKQIKTALIEEAVKQAVDHPYDDGKPSNEVYERVGDEVLRFTRRAVYEGMKPDDIRKEVREKFDVRLTVGDLRLLLATRNPLGRR